MEETAGRSYEELVAEALTEERALKSSLEQRAAFVITSSGALTTLQLGLAAVVTGADSGSLPLFSKVMLLVSVALFCGAAVLALGIQRPTDYKEAKLKGLQDLVADGGAWKAPLVNGQRGVATNRVEILGGFREVNASKAKTLRKALTAEVWAVVAVALSVAGVVLASL